MALTLAPRQQLVDLRQAVADRVLRQALQVQIERRVHVDGLRWSWSSGRDTARSSAWSTKSTKYGASASSARCDNGQRLAGRAVGRVLFDEAGIGHRLQDDVAALLASVRGC